MPANRGVGPENWSPQPDFASHWSAEPTLDERVVEFNNPLAVAECLVDNPECETYRGLLSQVQIEELALESAVAIVAARNEKRMRAIQAITNEAGGPTEDKPVTKTIYVGFEQDLSTGKKRSFSTVM